MAARFECEGRLAQVHQGAITVFSRASTQGSLQFSEKNWAWTLLTRYFLGISL